ncbi:response regulator transcription factor [Marinomonas sp. C2222]|uniref:Response regulator transcription factor n=1 Tax=Marinomonas sargassi TaxID=2984494 RepID=A0ABT2YV42_9GAMM|nr:response regulator transcription factor [Marinomonas sargassi]MCV2403748.1 response regulator transcription factor [Marinomonas sargassi]
MFNSRILIIEDDAFLGEKVSQLLESKGCFTEVYRDGEQGLLAALKSSFDLILLDIMLPSINGLKVLSLLRKERQTPVMMLTALGAEEDRIKGLSFGADDYLPKPFNFTEMSLRVDALLRRTLQNTPSKNVLTLEDDFLSLTRMDHQVTYQSHAIDLTPIQFKLLWLLVENKSSTLSKAYLSQSALGKPHNQYDRSLDMHISRIRKKLVSVGMPSEHITTVHGKGYCYR